MSENNKNIPTDGMEINGVWLTDEELYLYRYIPDVVRLKLYISRMLICESMEQLTSQVLLPMYVSEPLVRSVISTDKFYMKLLPFISQNIKAKRGTLYKHITDMVADLSKQDILDARSKPMMQLIENMKLQAPKVGEEAVYSLQIVVSNSVDESGNLIYASTVLVGNVFVRKSASKNFDGEMLPSGMCAYCIEGTSAAIVEFLSYISTLLSDEQVESVRYTSDRYDKDEITLEQAFKIAEYERSIE